MYMLAYDGDKYEERNQTRQAWYLTEGQHKVMGLWEVANSLGFFCTAKSDYIENEDLLAAEIREWLEECSSDRITMVCLADNDRARKISAEACRSLGSGFPRLGFPRLCPIVYATAGNDTRHGHGIAARLLRNGQFPEELTRVHPDIFGPVTAEDNLEWEAEQAVVHCGDNQEQSMESNMRTATVLVKALTRVLDGELAAEERWTTDPDNPELYRGYTQR
jgi:hypothetical protein